MATFRSSLLVVLLAGCPSATKPKPLPPLPHAAVAHYLDGKLAANHEDWSAAADALAEAARAAADQPMIAVELARAQWKAKRPEAAQATLAAARTKWPKHAAVWLASGDVSTPAEATRYYQKAIELEPEDERAYLGLAKLESPARALATLQRLVKKVPDSVDGRYRLAQRLGAADKLDAAIRELREVLERDPDHIDARLDLGGQFIHVRPFSQELRRR